MIRSLWIAKTGMEGQQTKLDAVSNNLANVGTNGFKRAGVVFEDLMYQNLRQAGAAAGAQGQLPTGLQIGLGVRAAATTRNFAQGNLTQTGNVYDLAIKGQGFFQVQMPDGSTAYTRDGAFQVNADGELVTSNGDAVQPAITVPPDATSVTIAADGTVSVGVPGQAEPVQIGQLQIAAFVNPA
ncbi:MAG TPA: flagellar hook-basal body complex protein, partial [Rubrivivax sp.]|nr:flagellar hook-basal body complex protein [Rubrivivax sp.]